MRDLTKMISILN